MKKQPIKKRKPAQQKITELDIMEARIELLEDEIQNLRHYVSVQYSSRFSDKDIDNAIAAAKKINTEHPFKLVRDTMVDSSINIGPERLFDMFMELINGNKIEHGIAIEAGGLLVKMLRDSIGNEIKTNDIRNKALHSAVERAISI